jgi:cytochrome P450
MIDVEGFIARYQDLDNPYDFYDELRGRGRVLFIEQLNRWLVAGYDQALFLLKHENTSNDRRNWDDYVLPAGLDRPPGGITAMDPPDHTRLRSLVHQAFTPRLLERLKPKIEQLTDDLLTEADERGTVELMAAISYPLIAASLAELLGIPLADQADFLAQSIAFSDTFDPVSHLVLADDGMVAYDKLVSHFTSLLDDRRKDPKDDLITALLLAEADGSRLTGDELLEMCLGLTVAGLETTANIVGNGLYALLEHRDQLDRLRADPSLADTAFEELMRYDAPVQLAGRVAVADIEVDGQVIRKGQMAGILIGAANRDPAAFDRPNELDLARWPNRHLGFSRGIHFCLGAPLARISGAPMLTKMATRFPDLHLAGEAKRRNNVHVRGFESMPVAFR